ncbi:hypothetical protein [Litorihabitans aurantiacus]|uniref:Uncharacterized protein n=1 Tax=Litorihabitans aurantiacus TaxID=1930061 RepID=A0AA37UVS6_9MICO|nr:hypothetical protein [Litorihabitans aurantiacus]GMA31257.1 hypothetical protein GCM10025875_12490 [Litorihabitans aurantiacus]
MTNHERSPAWWFRFDAGAVRPATVPTLHQRVLLGRVRALAVALHESHARDGDGDGDGDGAVAVVPARRDAGDLLAECSTTVRALVRSGLTTDEIATHASISVGFLDRALDGRDEPAPRD